MLTLNGLEKSFSGHKAVHGISFTVQKGEVVSFLGQNGAGKSTTMRMVAGVLEPDAGDATIINASITKQRREAQAALGYLPEGAPLYRDMTPLHFLHFLAEAYGLAKTERNNAIERVIADARIANVASKPISALSKGYRRRVGLAGAILHDPPVLLLDEPTDGLDPIQKRAVRALITRMAEEKAIMISTHTLEEVPAMCSRVIIVDHGRVVADDSPDGLSGGKPDGLEKAFLELSTSVEGTNT
ncbi:MAG: ABC transporter ATP-binding protein [Pseudomonadota bacterium]